MTPSKVPDYKTQYDKWDATRMDAEENMNHQARYDKWASTYDEDVKKRNYKSPELVLDFLLELLELEKIPFTPNTPGLRVLDAGCGTGLLGKLMIDAGFSQIDGVDISQKMVDKAQQLGIYQTLLGECDLQKPLPSSLENQYDIIASAGVFTLDMVFPQTLAYLVRTAKPGCVIAIGSSSSWCEKYDFEGFYQKLSRAGYIELLKANLNAPYVANHNSTETLTANYWGFLVKNNNVQIG
ncbi:methyltransferase domain-containing protein [Scytonema hofmannii FACHB-248]|uniref:Methyltransferase domain-containing protein n=1 Tax=Scytonema hofmannii FACHB-248 TaxID=1842502 RepID=A0ABR8GV14_9CYAN|nr:MULTISPECIES: class I SAM-dependent methyltransferase [Nostocales]MBD2607027.1 methyltransferase domain-containing protein [Scytonema hofmannii FACHB-248]